MKDLLAFLIENITGSKDFEVKEDQESDSRVSYQVEASPDIVGLIIGKEGKTIKNLRKILSIKATKQNVGVNISVDSTQKD